MHAPTQPTLKAEAETQNLEAMFCTEGANLASKYTAVMSAEALMQALQRSFW